MWSQVQINEQEFLLKTDNTNSNPNIYSVTLTNFINLWQEEISEQNLVKRCQEMNPLFRVKPEIFLRHVLDLLQEETPGIVRNIEENGNSITLKLEHKLDCVKFKFQFHLLQTQDQMYKELTVPMLLMINELQRQKKMLTSLLVKKDIEIAQYKLEGAELVRKTVQTEPFNEESFIANCLDTLQDRKTEVFQHPTHVFTATTASLYKQVTSPRQPKMEVAIDSTNDMDTENTVQAILNETKLSPRKTSKSPKKLSMASRLQNTMVKREEQIKSENVPEKSKKRRALLPNL